MKLLYIYILLGAATFVLNLALTLHLLRSGSRQRLKEANFNNELITFRLAREHNAEGVTTEAVRYAETMLLEEEP
jgi:hypothetical protein